MRMSQVRALLRQPIYEKGVIMTLRRLKKKLCVWYIKKTKDPYRNPEMRQRIRDKKRLVRQLTAAEEEMMLWLARTKPKHDRRYMVEKEDE